MQHSLMSSVLQRGPVVTGPREIEAARRIFGGDTTVTLYRPGSTVRPSATAGSPDQAAARAPEAASRDRLSVLPQQPRAGSPTAWQGS